MFNYKQLARRRLGSPTNTYETLIKTSNDNSKYTECILGTIETCGSNSFGYNDNCSDGFLGGSSSFLENLECFNAHGGSHNCHSQSCCNRHTCSTNTSTSPHNGRIIIYNTDDDSDLSQEAVHKNVSEVCKYVIQLGIIIFII